MATFEEHMAAADSEWDKAQATVALQHQTIQGLEADLLAKNAKIVQLEAALAACEAEPPLTPTDPPPEPPPVTSKPPAIQDERFKNGVDWSRYFSDGNPSAPKERFQTVTEGLKVIWICGSPTGTARTELGIRAVQGGGETPLRAPIGSERYYLIEFVIPAEYKLDDAEKDHKRVLWQCHQSGEGIVNPPLSLELRNGTFRLVRSVGAEREELLDPDLDPDGIPCVKANVYRLLVRVIWHTTNGKIEGTFTNVTQALFKAFSKNAKTCSVGDGIQNKVGSYQPGSKSGDFPNGYKIEHVIRRWSIGNETNTFKDFA